MPPTRPNRRQEGPKMGPKRGHSGWPRQPFPTCSYPKIPAYSQEGPERPQDAPERPKRPGRELPEVLLQTTPGPPKRT
eukprot:2243525-Pyramimonas_sp.AAC.1